MLKQRKRGQYYLNTILFEQIFENSSDVFGQLTFRLLILNVEMEEDKACLHISSEHSSVKQKQIT